MIFMDTIWKYTLGLFLFVCFLLGQVSGQKVEKLERSYIGPAGKTNTSASGKLRVSHSIGGIMTLTGRGNTKKFTQGFQQPEACSDCDSTITDPPPSFACDNLYNIITPNQDGKNDAWIVEQLLTPTPGIDQVEVKIYTRWGQEVYTSPNYQNDWSGQDKNSRPLPNGTYYYLLIFDEDQKPCKGDVTILKEQE